MEVMVAGHETLALDALLEKVYRDGGYDFREYKRGTVTRRLARRLHASGSATYLEYLRFLDTHPEEYQILADYLTIKASGFFRSPYAFQRVARLVLPELFSYIKAQGRRETRVWSTACARGEEPYSIAILIAGFLGMRHDFDIFIHATDISRWALGEAQAGTYSLKDMEGLSPALLRDYFVQHGHSHEVRADIRQMVGFSYCDLTSNTPPPFMNLDCIFCCNVLIYWQRQLQQRVLDRLYDSLAVPGYLVLGEAETLPDSLGKKLECLDSKAKIYKKVTG